MADLAARLRRRPRTCSAISPSQPRFHVITGPTQGPECASIGQQLSIQGSPMAAAAPTSPDSRRRGIEELSSTVDLGMWTELINANSRLLAAMTRWCLKNPESLAREQDIGLWAEDFHRLEEGSMSLGPLRWQAERQQQADRLASAGVPPAVAQRLAVIPDLAHALDIIDLARQRDMSIPDIGKLFFPVGQALQLDALERVVAGMTMANPWQRWARQTIEDDLKRVRRLVAERILADAKGRTGEDAVDHFLAERAHALARLIRLTQALELRSDGDLAPLIVVARQIETLPGEVSSS